MYISPQAPTSMYCSLPCSRRRRQTLQRQLRKLLCRLWTGINARSPQEECRSQKRCHQSIFLPNYEGTAPHLLELQTLGEMRTQPTKTTDLFILAAWRYSSCRIGVYPVLLLVFYWIILTSSQNAETVTSAYHRQSCLVVLSTLDISLSYCNNIGKPQQI